MLDQPWSEFIRLEAIEKAYTDYEKLQELRRKAKQRSKKPPVEGS